MPSGEHLSSATRQLIYICHIIHAKSALDIFVDFFMGDATFITLYM